MFIVDNFFCRLFNLRCTTLLFGTDLLTVYELWASWLVARKEDGSRSLGRGVDGGTGGCWFRSWGGSCSGDKIQGRAGQGEGASTGKGGGVTCLRETGHTMQQDDSEKSADL